MDEKSLNNRLERDFCYAAAPQNPSSRRYKYKKERWHMSTQLSYDDLKQEIIQALQKNIIGTLATSDGNFVTARQVMIISEGLTFFCFTGSETRKFKQISANKNVALAINNIQIDGVATLKGHTSNPKNKGFLIAFEKISLEGYNFWRDKCLDPKTTLQLIKISPKRIAAYIPKPPAVYLDVLNIDKKTAIRYLMGEEYE